MHRCAIVPPSRTEMSPGRRLSGEVGEGVTRAGGDSPGHRRRPAADGGEPRVGDDRGDRPALFRRTTRRSSPQHEHRQVRPRTVNELAACATLTYTWKPAVPGRAPISQHGPTKLGRTRAAAEGSRSPPQLVQTHRPDELTSTPAFRVGRRCRPTYDRRSPGGGPVIPPTSATDYLELGERGLTGDRRKDMCRSLSPQQQVGCGDGTLSPAFPHVRKRNEPAAAGISSGL